MRKVWDGIGQPDAVKPLHHIYIVRSKGKALLRVANVFTTNVGEQVAAWVSRSTARWWGKKHTKKSGDAFRILKCDIPGCPVCRRKREQDNC